MKSDHPFWHLTTKEATERDRGFLVAILNLSVGTHMTFEEIYDAVTSNRMFSTNAISTASILNQIKKLEEIVLNTSQAVLRVQGVADAMKATLIKVQTALSDMAKAQSDANDRLLTSIKALQNNAGSGDTDALNAIADELTATLNSFQTVTDQLNATAAIETTIDVAPPPPPPPLPPVLTISPTSVSVPRGGTQQFSTSVPAILKANNGSIDTSGLYTPPTDTALTSDTVLATSSDGQSTSASVSITDAVPAPVPVPATTV